MPPNLIATIFRIRGAARPAIAALLVLLAAPALAGVSSAGPAGAIDGDLAPVANSAVSPVAQAASPAPSIDIPAEQTPQAAPDAPLAATEAGASQPGAATPAEANSAASAAQTAATTGAAPDGSTTWHKDDLVGAAEGVFGKGAAGLADMIQDLLKKQGEPNAYIVGREGGGALVFGLRYGSGTLYHKIEGQKPVYWTGPSLGFDVGANAASTFVLVYNLFDTEELYKRFGAGEGQAYLVGGFHVSYLRRGDKVLIPVRAGAGLRLGVNAGYMKFSHKQNWLPF